MSYAHRGLWNIAQPEARLCILRSNLCFGSPESDIAQPRGFVPIVKQVVKPLGANYGGCRRRCSNKTTMLTK
jgi:hypothetical protein